jgi:hypothetical protein
MPTALEQDETPLNVIFANGSSFLPFEATAWEGTRDQLSEGATR